MSWQRLNQGEAFLNFNKVTRKTCVSACLSPGKPYLRIEPQPGGVHCDA
jgi:hypothetical protein